MFTLLTRSEFKKTVNILFENIFYFFQTTVSRLREEQITFRMIK